MYAHKQREGGYRKRERVIKYSNICVNLNTQGIYGEICQTSRAGI